MGQYHNVKTLRRPHEVFLYGRQVTGVVECVTGEGGWLRRFIRGQDGKYILDGEEIRTGLLYGRVTIKPITAATDY